MLKDLAKNNFVRFILIIIIVALVFYIQHIYVNYNDKPMDKANDFLFALFNKPEMNNIDKYITDNFKEEILNENILLKLQNNETRDAFTRYKEIKKMSITYLNDYNAVIGLGFNRDSLVNEKTIFILKIIKTSSDSWVAKIFPKLVEDTMNWKIDGFFTNEDFDKINLDSTIDTDSLLEEVEKLLENDNYNKVIEFNNDLSDYLMRKEYIKLKDLYYRKIIFFEKIN